MKILMMVVLGMFFLGSVSRADCSIYIPEKMYNVEGYPVAFDFSKLLTEKKYSEVKTPSAARYQLLLKGTEREGRFFHYADGAFSVLDANQNIIASSAGEVRCWTELCGVEDYGNAFSKAYQSLETSLAVCPDVL